MTPGECLSSVAGEVCRDKWCSLGELGCGTVAQGLGDVWSVRESVHQCRIVRVVLKSAIECAKSWVYVEVQRNVITFWDVEVWGIKGSVG